MKYNPNVSGPSVIRFVLAVIVMISLVSSPALLTTVAMAQVPLAGIEPLIATGELTVTGNVTINGLRAMSGDTVLTDSVIKVDAKSSAVINLGRLGRIELGPGTELVVLLGDKNIGGNLRSGNIIVSSSAGVACQVTTPQGNVTTSGQEVAVIAIEVARCTTSVIARRSDAKVSSGARVEVLSAGQNVAIDDPDPNCEKKRSSTDAVAQTPGAQTGGVPGVPAGGGVPGGIGGVALATLIVFGIGASAPLIIALNQTDAAVAGQVVISVFVP